MAIDLDREPVSLEAAKLHLGVRLANRDDEIAGLIVAAREQIETYTGHALKRRQFRQSLSGLGSPPPAFDFGPVHRVVGISSATLGGDVVIVGDARVWGPFGNQWRLLPGVGGSWPASLGSAMVAIEYEAGFGDGEDGEAGEPVPQLLIRAMLLLVGHWFENHEAAVVGTSVAVLPFGVKDACRGFRPSGIV